MSTRVLKWWLYPILIASTCSCMHGLLVAGWNPAIAVFVLTVGNLTLIACLEYLLPFRREWAWWNDCQTVKDLLHGTMTVVVGPQLGQVLLTNTVLILAAGVADRYEGGVWPREWPLAAQLMAFVVLTDFVEWVKHWTFHHVRYMWPVHVLHHNSDRLHVAKAGRLHFLESTIRYALLTAPFLVLGTPSEVFIWYAVVVNTLGNLNHSNIDFALPKFSHYLLMTPQNHRLHHAKDASLGCSNLSTVTPWPDLLFGSYKSPAQYGLGEVGVEVDRVPRDFLGQLLTPLMWIHLVEQADRQSPTCKSVHRGGQSR